jgi:hypothetical protein
MRAMVIALSAGLLLMLPATSRAQPGYAPLPPPMRPALGPLPSPEGGPPARIGAPCPPGAPCAPTATIPSTGGPAGEVQINAAEIGEIRNLCSRTGYDWSQYEICRRLR